MDWTGFHPIFSSTHFTGGGLEEEFYGTKGLLVWGIHTRKIDVVFFQFLI